MIGDFYLCDKNVYVFVNDHGTVEKIKTPKWYRVLILYFLHAIGKKKTLPEIREYLKGV